MKIFGILLVTFFLGMMVKMSVYAYDTDTNKHFLASFSGVLQIHTYRNGNIINSKNILENDRWNHVYWPSFNQDKRIIYFYAKDRLDQESIACIYSLDLSKKDREPKKMINNARLPSLSPNKNIMAFYRHPNQLWIQNLEEMKEKKLTSDMSNYQPGVWVSNTHLLYYDLSNSLVVIDIIKKIKQKTGYKNIIPGSLSPDGKKVLCGSSDSKKIYIYSPQFNELTLLKENKFQSIGTSFIWLPGGDSFLFTMQTWSNILKLNESRDLFIYGLNERNESFVFPQIALFGGFFI